MDNITYSFIIPHKNCPNLLQRCVNSIPKRADIQIIIVDDNSDVDKRPTISREGMEIVFLDAANSKGAGRARNVGLEKAKGKWLLFADSDDFYVDGFINILDIYKDTDCDLIYFNVISAYSDTLEITNRVDGLRTSLEKVLKNGETLDLLRYKYHTPWNKMYSLRMIKIYKLEFEEILQGNDCRFSYMTGYFSKNIKVIPDEIYVYTYTNNSITRRRKNPTLRLCGLCNFYKQRYFLSFVNHKDWSQNIFQFLIRIYCHFGVFESIKHGVSLITNLRFVMKERTKYVELANDISYDVQNDRR